MNFYVGEAVLFTYPKSELHLKIFSINFPFAQQSAFRYVFRALCSNPPAKAWVTVKSGSEMQSYQQ